MVPADVVTAVMEYCWLLWLCVEVAARVVATSPCNAFVEPKNEAVNCALLAESIDAMRLMPPAGMRARDVDWSYGRWE
jgi:hypothetical protein